KPSHPDAVAFLLDQIRRNSGQLTLIAIGPLMNVGAAIDKDPATFRKLKRVIMMGGSIKRGYGDFGFGPPPPPEPEWNILNDIPSAQKLFAAGVPLFVMPLDATQLKLDEVKRAFLFSQGTPLTDALTILEHSYRRQRFPRVVSPPSPSQTRTPRSLGPGVARNGAPECRTSQSSSQWFCGPCNRVGAGRDNSAPPQSPALCRPSRKSRIAGIRAAPGQTRHHRESPARPRIKSGPSIPSAAGPIHGPASPSRYSGRRLDNQSRRSYLRSPCAGLSRFWL